MHSNTALKHAGSSLTAATTKNGRFSGINSGNKEYQLAVRPQSTQVTNPAPIQLHSNFFLNKNSNTEEIP